MDGKQEIAFGPQDSANKPPHIEAVGASSHTWAISAEAVESREDNAPHGSGATASIGAEVLASPESDAPSGSGNHGQPIASTVEKPCHVTKRRSAPALIQGRISPASALSDVTLLNPSRQASPLISGTPIRLADADDDDYINISSSAQQDLSSSVWGSLCKIEKEKTRYHELVEELQAELATERENAQHDRGVARQAFDEARDDIADLEAEVSELKDRLENDLVEELQADLATERENARYDRDLARQALGEAQDDIADLEAEVSELKDQLEIERQNAEDHLSAYNRSDRDATAIITDCHERISELEDRLNYEQRKARHNFSIAEEYMGRAKSWQDAFHQLGHNPDALFRMLVEELKVRGLVFHDGRFHRIGLRRAVDVEEWVAGSDDGSLRVQEVNEEDDPENVMGEMPNADIDASTDVVSSEDENGSIDDETAPPLQLVKHRKVRAVNRSNEANIATGDMPSPLQNSRIPSFGSRLPPPTMGNGLLKSLLWSQCKE